MNYAEAIQRGKSPSCGNCLFRDKGGSCFRFPPHRVEYPNHGVTVYERAVVRSKDVCGEWSPRVNYRP